MDEADVMHIYKSLRDAPQFPADWKSKEPPGHRRKLPMTNRRLLAQLRDELPGAWHEFYHYGFGGSELHYFGHESGAVFNVKHVQK